MAKLIYREPLSARTLADAVATAFRVSDPGEQLDSFGADIVEIRRRDGMDGPRWAICLRGFCLNGETLAWDWEPQPSSRDEAYLRRHRFHTAEEAFATWDYARARWQRVDAIPFGDG